MVPFEGVEKKCEVTVGPHIDLRSLPSSFWHELVQACAAEVLSVVRSATCDAYLLSESSLFVWRRRLLLITCGRTRLVQSIHYLLDQLGRPAIESLRFQRKNENFAHLQPTSFDQDAATLLDRVPGEQRLLGSASGHYTQVFHMQSEATAPPASQTYELLMHHLSDRATAALRQPDLSATAIRKRLQIGSMIPGAIVDDFVFEPFGYSLNALRGSEYLTIHITPERDGSYVSLETNIDLAPILAIPLQIFEPQSFDLVLCNAPQVDALLARTPDRYSAVARQTEHLSGGHRLDFAHVASTAAP